MREESVRPILSLQNISFSYHGKNSGKKALDDVSLDIFPGEKIAVLGPNGAGKSTFFLQCNGVLAPDLGRILYKGVPVTKKNLTALRKGVGIIFQDADSQMVAPTVRSEISFGPMNLKLPIPEVWRRVERAAEYMNLQGFEDRPPHYLSGGEKKRVSIADIIAMEPEVFLFDEPMSSLDCKSIRQLKDVLLKLADQGKTLVISTHDVDFAYEWADRILVFRGGRLWADGTPPAIFEQTELLEEANLDSPIIYRIAKILEAKNLLKEKGRYPRTAEELGGCL